MSEPNPNETPIVGPSFSPRLDVLPPLTSLDRNGTNRYHLGVVNGALDYIAVDLGITASTTLQVRSAPGPIRTTSLFKEKIKNKGT